jgi:hypothetical protein
MLRIHATRIPTEVIDLQPFWNWTFLAFVGITMRDDCLFAETSIALPCCLRAKPLPAPLATLDILIESLVGRHTKMNRLTITVPVAIVAVAKGARPIRPLAPLNATKQSLV